MITFRYHTKLILAIVLLFCIGVSCTAGPSKISRCRDGYEIKSPQYKAKLAGGRFEYYPKGLSNAGLIYTLSSVRVGNTSLVRDLTPDLTVQGNIISVNYSDELSETYTPLHSGIEQCWVISKRPSASGALVICGKVRSPFAVISSPNGCDFVDRQGKAVFSYGLVTVVDSKGSKYSCRPKIDHGTLTITVPKSYLDKAVFPITVDPVVGTEVQLCPTFSAAPENQEDIQICASQYGYLAVWQDSRGTNGTDIYACRLSATGQVQDLFGIEVSSASGDQTDPSVSWDGQNYLVVWADRRILGQQHIYGARVKATGEVIDKQGIPISGTTGTQAFPRVAGDMGSFLVVWQDTRTTSADIYCCKVSDDGAMSRSSGIATSTNNEETPDVAFNGSYFLVAWNDYRNSASTGTDIYGCRVARTGIRTGLDILMSCSSSSLTTGAAGDQTCPKVAQCSTQWMVAWQDARNGVSNLDIYATRISSSGSVLEKGGIGVCKATGSQEIPSIGYSGSNMLVAWRNDSDKLIRGARVTTVGAVSDISGVAISTGIAGSMGTACAGKDGKFLVGWNSLSITDANTLVALIPGTGTVQSSAGTTASMALASQEDYSIADNGTEYAVVWSQMVGGSYHIYGARYSRAGTLLTPTAINITGAYYGNQIQPSIAWSGSQYLLVWSGDDSFQTSAMDIRGWRLDSNLSRIGSSPILISSEMEDQSRPCVASNRSNYLVVWEDSKNRAAPGYYCDIYGALVNTSGTVTTPDISVNLSNYNQWKPKIASDGTNYFAVWEDYRLGLDQRQIYGTKISSTGSVSSGSGVLFPATSKNQSSPYIIFANGSYFVTWSDNTKVTGCRVSTAGATIDKSGIEIDSGSAKRSCPSACWDGTKYQAVWEDYRSLYTGNSDLYYTTADAACVVSPYPESALVSDLFPQYQPKLFAQGSNGTLFFVRCRNYSYGLTAVTLTDQPVRIVQYISEVKSLPAGTIVSLDSKVVTGAFTGYFYVEDEDRSNGIKVISTVAVSIGQLINITGAVSVSDGQTTINTNVMAVMGIASDPPKPLGIRGDWLGGAALNSNTPGVSGGIGANNIGLLVSTWGNVTTTSTNYFTIECKPGISVKVMCGTLTKPAVGKIVGVTGICSCEVVAGSICRVIEARQQSDIIIYK